MFRIAVMPLSYRKCLILFELIYSCTSVQSQQKRNSNKKKRGKFRKLSVGDKNTNSFSNFELNFLYRFLFGLLNEKQKKI